MQVVHAKSYLTLKPPCSRCFAIFWPSQTTLSSVTASSDPESTGYAIGQTIHCFTAVTGVFQGVSITGDVGYTCGDTKWREFCA